MRGNTETSLTAHPSSKWHHYRLRNRKFGEFGEKSEKKIRGTTPSSDPFCPQTSLIESYRLHVSAYAPDKGKGAFFGGSRLVGGRRGWFFR